MIKELQKVLDHFSSGSDSGSCCKSEASMRIPGSDSGSCCKSEASMRIPVGNGISFWARWDPDIKDDHHQMVEIPVMSLKYMTDQIDELTQERDKLRDILEDARMG